MFVVALTCLLVRSFSVSAPNASVPRHDASTRHKTPPFRAAIRAENHRRIAALNQNASNLRFRLNHFADWTDAELASNGLTVERSRWSVPPLVSNTSLPPNLAFCGPYVKHNANNKVDHCAGVSMNQGNCGCCYAMAIAHLLQITYHRLSGRNELFSTQQIIDCGSQRRCCGDWPQRVLRTMRWFVRERDYPFRDISNTDCTTQQCRPGKRTPLEQTGFIEFGGVYDKETLKRVIFDYGPFLAMLRVDKDFHFYWRGIYRCGPTRDAVVNHVVVVVGYGVEDGTDFVIIRNSWGAGWGEGGYARIALDDDGWCGIGGTSGGSSSTGVIIAARLSSVGYADYTPQETNEKG